MARWIRKLLFGKDYKDQPMQKYWVQRHAGQIVRGGSPLHHGFEGVFVLGFGVVFDVELRQVVGAEMGDV